MDNWQFLMQKQGDRGWNTLESSHLQILPGKYRLLARSWLVNTDVEVRVTHIATEEVPPKRRVLRRSRRTNADGLMAVIPFTQFKPGIWELRCSGDVMSEMLGKSWQHSLHIEVLSPVPSELSPELLSELPSIPIPEHNDQDLLIENEVNMVMNPLVNPMWLRGETTEQILQNLLDIALPAEDPEIAAEVTDDVLTLPDPLLVNMTLDQDTYVVKWGSSFTIQGYVEINDLENLPDEKLQIKKLSNLQLEISLITPGNSQVINYIEQSLSDKILPFSFTSSIEISANCESKLLLGDIHLYGVYEDFDQVKLLGSHSFIITADISELLAVQNQSSLVDNSQENDESLEEKRVLGLELFNVAKTPSLAQFHVLQPAVKKVLPPQIKPEGMGEVVVPQLPAIPKSPASLVVDESSVKVISPPPPINLVKLQIKPVKSSFPYLLKIKPYQDELRKNGPVLPVTKSHKPDNIPVDNEVVNEHLQEAICNIANIDEVPKDELLEDELLEVDDPSLLSVNISASENSPQLLADDDIMDQYLREAIGNIPDVPIVDNLAQDIVNVDENISIINTIDSELSTLPESNISEYSEFSEYKEDINLELSTLPESNIADIAEDVEFVEENVNLEVEVNELNVQEVIEEVNENKLSFSLLQQWREKHEDSIYSEVNTAEIDEINPGENDVFDINENTPLAEVEEVSQPLEISIPIQEIKPEVKPNWLSQEVVIDDVVIDDVVEEKKDILPVEEKIDVVDFVMMESLPTPQLYLPEGELIAGTSMMVRFELPIILSDINVRLWIEDYQTRSLLDIPHIITDLHSTTWGTMEGVANLIVPYGCLEMRVGAIAYHQVTQQEGNKVTILKKIIPADLPKMDFDDLLGF